ncbi:MAG: histidine--tRNA ligase [Candidatus Eremiobacteraeota bacterium]|nr:histidine--tRNA ligase [Candidatus Eremiobacteraeota bacterium]MBV8356173.1 histidine--tRNA ligase [Candidatus Eremiobacteraeota bacterium]
MEITAPRGTQDLYPPESRRWETFEAAARELAARFGYGEIRTPMFEATELFVRSVGETTDIVEKEMYTFTDKGGRSMTLRPEWTAPVVRAMLQHRLLEAGPVRLFYIGPFFRYERPQAGRYRQANQFGIECFGFAGAEADVEVMRLALLLIGRYGIDDATLRLNSTGDAACRPGYRDKLAAYFTPLAAQLSEDSLRRLERNPLRILDSKAPEDQPLIQNAPRLLDSLCTPCAEHFAEVCAYLDATGARYVVDSRIVRGLDYYTRTVFEIVSPELGAQNTICGGGRYDNLVESLGGPPTPGVGFGLGEERFLMLARDAGGEQPRRGFQVVALGDAARAWLVPVVDALRSSGALPVHVDYQTRRIAAHFKLADRNRARYALIVGDEELASHEVVLRDVETRTERRLSTPGDARSVAGAIAEAVEGRG